MVFADERECSDCGAMVRDGAGHICANGRVVRAEDFVEARAARRIEGKPKVSPEEFFKPIAHPPIAHLPVEAAARKDVPMARGLLDYFPKALAAVAEVSRVGNDQHNPGQPIHWSRGKSDDHADCLVRHLLERGTVDTDGVRHSAKVAWRALALLQIELEAAR